MRGKLIFSILIIIILISSFSFAKNLVMILPQDSSTPDNLDCIFNGNECIGNCNAHWFVNDKEIKIGPKLNLGNLKTNDKIKCEVWLNAPSGSIKMGSDIIKIKPNVEGNHKKYIPSFINNLLSKIINIF